jgi:hypothetical protein
MRTIFRSENLKGKYSLEDLDIDGKIKVEEIFEEEGWKVSNELIC